MYDNLKAWFDKVLDQDEKWIDESAWKDLQALSKKGSNRTHKPIVLEHRTVKLSVSKDRVGGRGLHAYFAVYDSEANREHGMGRGLIYQNSGRKPEDVIHTWSRYRNTPGAEPGRMGFR